VSVIYRLGASNILILIKGTSERKSSGTSAVVNCVLLGFFWQCVIVLQVVEGEAQNIVSEQKTSKVMVKILHEDATTTDQMYFLHEVKPYRELNHPNILKLLGRCLETDPFLILLEACPSVSCGIAQLESDTNRLLQVVTLLTCIWSVYCFNFSQDDWGFLWFSSVSAGNYLDSTTFVIY
jgi:hypothetical protein